MASNEKNKTMINDLIDTQSNMVDQMVESTKNITKNIPFVSETIDRGHKIVKDNLKTQSEFVAQMNDHISKSQEQMNTNNQDAQNFFKQWLENQMTMAKNMYSQMNQTASSSATNNNMDWMKNWMNMMNQSNNPWNQFMQQNSFMNMMNNNPFMNQNTWKNQSGEFVNQWSQMTKQYLDNMNNSYGDWIKQFSNLTSADTFKGMNNMTENMNKFFELWMPMFKSMNDKTFNTESFMNTMNPEKFKSFVDSFFKFMPEDSQKMIEQMNTQFVQYMKEMTQNGLSNYSNIKNQWQQFPGINNNPYTGAWEMYHNWRIAMNEAVSPLTKLMNQNGPVKSAQVWNEISELMTEFNIKNNELQYMIYQHGLKVMDRLADKVATQLSEGKTIDSFVKLYQDWLVTGDEVFTNLFNSDAYSKLMTEVSSLQMKLKKDIDDQMESMFLVNMPIPTRTEMDEVYKSIYDLKKMYRNLERMWAAKEEVKTETPSEASKKATPKKK